MMHQLAVAFHMVCMVDGLIVMVALAALVPWAWFCLARDLRRSVYK